MKILCIALIMAVALFSAAAQASADSEFSSLITSMDVQADANMADFQGRLSVYFGAPALQVETIIRSVDRPGDAYMCFRIAEITKKPVDVVLKEYKANKRKGWGVIAKNLGIKPGSKEFHELKKNKLPSDAAGHGKGKGKGKGRGKDKD
ncbi:MAG: hypothetical protein C4550_02250 [Nitrospiraceae bacterium]|nr:MAG: hypothetical protein C4550_02250 [Nitrospiraceae bacterium]